MEKWEKLKEKKIEFRKRMEMKRERMFQNQMSKEERDEFMHKIRLHRPDAVDDFVKFTQEEEKSERTDSDETKSSDTSKRRTESSEDEFERNTRNVLKNHFGMSDEELDRLDIGTEKRESRSNPRDERRRYQKTPDTDFSRDDQFMAGLNTSRDATSWRDFLNRAEKNYSERIKQMKNNRVESVQTSKKYNIEKQNHGEKFVLLILLAFMILGYSEYRYETKID